MKELEIMAGKTYSRGKRKRYVVGFQLYFVNYVTPGGRGSVTGVPIWKFKEWAQRECDCSTKECSCNHTKKEHGDNGNVPLVSESKAPQQDAEPESTD